MCLRDCVQTYDASTYIFHVSHLDTHMCMSYVGKRIQIFMHVKKYNMIHMYTSLALSIAIACMFQSKLLTR